MATQNTNSIKTNPLFFEDDSDFEFENNKPQ